MESGNRTIVLSDKRWIDFWKSALLPALLVMSIVTLALVYSLTVIFPGEHWKMLPSLLAEGLGNADWGRALLRHFDLVFMFGLIAAQLLYLHRAQRQENLILSPDGIRYTSPLPQWLKRFRPDWSLVWSEIHKIELASINNFKRDPEFILMTLHSATGKQRLFPARWVDADTYSRPAFRFTLSSSTREETTRSALSSEIMRYISGNFPDIPVDAFAGPAQAFTSLEKHAHGRVALGIVALLILYAIADFVAGPYSYIDEPAALLHIFIPAGIVGAVISGIWLYKSTLPAGEKSGLALLIGMLVAVAMIPGALRINALTDSGGVYDYYVTQSSDSVVLRPVIEGMPVIDYFAKKKFWDEFGKDDTYPVQLRKGVLGFYQFNSSIIVEDIRSREKY